MTGLFAVGWVALYTACAAMAIARWAQRRAASPRAPIDDDVVLLRPCAGAEPGLAERLSRSAGARRVVIAVGSFADGAAAAAAEAVAALGRRGVLADVVETHAVGPNHKVDQLARALVRSPVARAAVTIVVADPDVELSDAELPALLAELDAPGVAAAWAPPVEAGAVLAAGDAVSHAVLGASLHAFPLLAGIDPTGMVGKLFAIRREALDEVGGFAALRTHLGEDMELARRLRARGGRVVAAKVLARSVAEGRPLAAVHARYVRWLQVVRAQRTALLASYPALLAPLPLLLVLGALGARSEQQALVAATAVGVLVRIGVAVAARRAAGLAPAPVVAAGQALVADLALLAALASALASRRVSWRSGTLVLGAGGRLEETPR